MYGAVREELQATLGEIRAAGLYKNERQLASPQAAHVSAGGKDVLNFCANNYLGLADHPAVVAAAKAGKSDTVESKKVKWFANADDIAAFVPPRPLGVAQPA